MAGNRSRLAGKSKRGRWSGRMGFGASLRIACGSSRSSRRTQGAALVASLPPAPAPVVSPTGGERAADAHENRPPPGRRRRASARVRNYRGSRHDVADNGGSGGQSAIIIFGLKNMGGDEWTEKSEGAVRPRCGPLRRSHGPGGMR